MARDENGPIYLLSRKCAMEIVEHACGVVAVGEGFDDLRSKFSQDRWIQEGAEDLLGKVWDVGGEPIFGFKFRVIETFLGV